MDLLDKLRDYCEDNVSVYGFADLRNFKDEIFSHYLKDYDFAISIGINIPDDIVEDLDSVEGRKRYNKAVMDVNALLNDAAGDIVKMLELDCFRAVNVDSSYILPDEYFVGEISHKLVANLAGLGWIGKSALFINPLYGPRIRWATVLTDARLPVENKRMKSGCKSCRLCVVNCPAGAIRGDEFDENVPRDERYNAGACYGYFEKLESLGTPGKCGVCVKVCPWGLVNKNSRQKEDIYSQK